MEWRAQRIFGPEGLEEEIQSVRCFDMDRIHRNSAEERILSKILNWSENSQCVASFGGPSARNLPVQMGRQPEWCLE